MRQRYLHAWEPNEGLPVQVGPVRAEHQYQAVPGCSVVQNDDYGKYQAPDLRSDSPESQNGQAEKSNF
jgi:hypothetical protein